MSTTSRGGDLRSRRTESHLRNALLELIPEHGYESITVVDVCERAMVHRTTFYKHYAGKRELLDDLVDDHVARLVDPDDVVMDALMGSAGRAEAVRILTELFRAAERSRSFFGLLVDRSLADALTPAMTEALAGHLMGAAEWPASARHADATARLRAHLHAGLVVNALAWSMRASAPLAPADLARMLADEFFPGGATHSMEHAAH